MTEKAERNLIKVEGGGAWKPVAVVVCSILGFLALLYFVPKIAFRGPGKGGTGKGMDDSKSRVAKPYKPSRFHLSFSGIKVVDPQGKVEQDSNLTAEILIMFIEQANEDGLDPVIEIADSANYDSTRALILELSKRGLLFTVIRVEDER